MSSRMTKLLATVSLLVAVWATPRAHAFEGGTTHAGITAEALLGSRLHAFLRREHGLSLGLFSRLKLSSSNMVKREARVLRHHLVRLDPTGGFRPDARGGLHAAGWVMAGSVLADVPSSTNRHHFYSPVLKKGLDQPNLLLGTMTRFVATLEGGDTVRELFTATGFDLTGDSAPSWIKSPTNPRSADRFYAHLADSVSAESPRRRQHSLAMALMAMGDLLHVLQDMASPSHVRNDFVKGHMQRLGRSSFNRGAAFERYVASVYGQHGIPSYEGPAIQRARLAHYFSSPRWDGLADVTNLAHFSPGNLPAPVKVLRGADPKELHGRLAKRLPMSKPALPAFDLACASRGVCHLKGKLGAMAAYRIDRKGRLRFFLDRTCHASSAGHLLPLAIGYSAGLVDHLLRGRVTLERKGDDLKVLNLGAPLKDARVTVLAQDAAGKRTRLVSPAAKLPAARGAVLASAKVTVAGATELIVLVRGKDSLGEPLVATARLALAPASQPASQHTSTPKKPAIAAPPPPATEAGK